MQTQQPVRINIGGGLSTLLTVVFVTLKLTNYIAWSWVWVLSPLWISFALWLIFIIGIFLIAAIAG